MVRVNTLIDVTEWSERKGVPVRENKMCASHQSRGISPLTATYRDLPACHKNKLAQTHSRWLLDGMHGDLRSRCQELRHQECVCLLLLGRGIAVLAWFMQVSAIQLILACATTRKASWTSCYSVVPQKKGQKGNRPTGKRQKGKRTLIIWLTIL